MATSLNDDIHDASMYKDSVFVLFFYKEIDIFTWFCVALNQNSLFSNPSLKPFLIFNAWNLCKSYLVSRFFELENRMISSWFQKSFEMIEEEISNCAFEPNFGHKRRKGGTRDSPITKIWFLLCWWKNGKYHSIWFHFNNRASQFYLLSCTNRIEIHVRIFYFTQCTL